MTPCAGVAHLNHRAALVTVDHRCAHCAHYRAGQMLQAADAGGNRRASDCATDREWIVPAVSFAACLNYEAETL